MDKPILTATGLVKNYGAYQALVETDLALYPGEMVLLTGPNGAGKTTLLHCLSGIQAPSRGQTVLDGFDLVHDEVQFLKRLAFVPDVPRFYPELTAWEHLQFIASAHRAMDDFDQRAETLLKEYQLWEARNLFPHHYSRGMQLKLGLLMAFIRPFEVLLLDEPTSALDGEAAGLLAQTLAAYKANGAAILISTHHLDLLQPIADRTWSMRQGRLETGV